MPVSLLLARLLAAALLLLAGSAYLQRPGPSMSGLLRFAAAAAVAAAHGREAIPWGALDSSPLLTAQQVQRSRRAAAPLGARRAGWASEPESRLTPAASAAAALAFINQPGFLPWPVPGSALLQQLGAAMGELLRLRTGSAWAAPGPLTAQQPGAHSVSQRIMSPQRALLQLPRGGAAAPAAAALSPAQRFGYGTLTRAAAPAPTPQGQRPSSQPVAPAPALSLLQLLLPRRRVPAPAPAPAPANGCVSVGFLCVASFSTINCVAASLMAHGACARVSSLD